MSEVVFFDEGHDYQSVGENKIDWISVSTLTKQFEEPFIAALQAEKSTKNKNSKWYGIPPDEILGIWEAESLRSTTLGTWYHAGEEKKLLDAGRVFRYGKELPVFAPIWEGNKKIAPNQRLEEGIYPELLVYLKSEGVCGQSDDTTIANGGIYIDDHKTNKEVTTEAYRTWEGVTKKLNRPLQHLEAHHVTKFGLQLSTYAYIIKKHNPLLEVRDLTINHILFEEAGRDKYDNPITLLDSNGEPIVKDKVKIPVPYLGKEVELMFRWLKLNRNNLRKN